MQILSLLPVLIFDVNDLLTLSFINSKICEPCLFLFSVFSVQKSASKIMKNLFLVRLKSQHAGDLRHRHPHSVIPKG